MGIEVIAPMSNSRRSQTLAIVSCRLRRTGVPAEIEKTSDALGGPTEARRFESVRKEFNIRERRFIFVSTPNDTPVTCALTLPLTRHIVEAACIVYPTGKHKWRAPVLPSLKVPRHEKAISEYLRGAEAAVRA